MKTVLVLLAGFTSLNAFANTQVTCKNEGGVLVFSGVAELSSPLEPGPFKRAMRLPYTTLVADRPANVMDRLSLKRYLDIDLPDCKGPYAMIFEKEKRAGELKCATGESVELKSFDGTEEAYWQAFGLSRKDAQCAVIVDKVDERSLSSLKAKKKAKP